jgi:hypothetical protein
VALAGGGRVAEWPLDGIREEIITDIRPSNWLAITIFDIESKHAKNLKSESCYLKEGFR